jgi:hypothetical protein
MVAEEVEEEEDRAISTLARIFHYSKLPITKLIVNSNSCCLEEAIYSKVFSKSGGERTNKNLGSHCATKFSFGCSSLFVVEYNS